MEGAVIDAPSVAKFRQTGSGLRADASDPTLAPSSTLIAERLAGFYGEVLPDLVKGTLLDLGCGSSPLRPLYDTAADRAWLVDWPASLHVVRPHVFADLNRPIPFRSAIADVAVLADVLEHLSSPSIVLSEAARILRHDGVLVGTVPFAYWLHEEPHDYFRYTEHGLRHLLTEAGFGRVEIRRLGGAVDVAFDLVGKFASLLPILGPRLARYLQAAWFSLSSRWPRVGDAHTHFRRLPLAYGFIARKERWIRPG